LEYTEQVCDIEFINTVWFRNGKNVPHHFQNISFVKGVPEFENPENVPTLIVLDDLIECLSYKLERIIY